MSAPAERAIVIAYDGSADADHAIRTAARLLRGQVIVVHACAMPGSATVAVPGPGMALALDPEIVVELDQQAQERGRELAARGVQVAQDAGFTAEPELVSADRLHGAWSAIVAAAEEHDASVIVIARSHLSGLGEKLFGSVESGVVRHAACPVLVVPGHPG